MYTLLFVIIINLFMFMHSNRLYKSIKSGEMKCSNELKIYISAYKIIFLASLILGIYTFITIYILRWVRTQRNFILNL